MSILLNLRLGFCCYFYYRRSISVQAQLRAISGATNRKMHEEDALREEKQFMENFTKTELRENRALCSSMRVKLKYYGEEVARLR